MLMMMYDQTLRKREETSVLIESENAMLETATADGALLYTLTGVDER
jgi:hypothetical protein